MTLSFRQPCSSQKAFTLANCILLVATMLLAACGSEDDIGAHLEKAKQYRQEHKHNAAIIELKNVLQEDAKHQQARYLLGMSYLATGNGASAEKELQKAKELGYTGKDLTPALARAMVLQGKYDEALSLITIDDGLTEQQKMDLRILRGDANLGKGDIAQASSDYEQALSLDNNASGALVGLAKVSLAQGDLDQAENRIAPLDKRDENAIDTLLLKAEIATRRKQLDKAEDFYRRAIEAGKKQNNTAQQLNALSKLSFVLIANNKPEAAGDAINKLSKAVSGHPLPKYLRALLAYTQKDYDTALENLQQVVAVAPDHLPASLLMGAVHYAKGNYELANSYLSTFVNRVPTHIQARTLLGIVRLKLNKPEEAQEALDAAVESSRNDAGLLAAIGKAATASGNARMGADYLERARQSKPDNPQIRAELAKVYLQEGAYDSAIKELEQITGDQVDQAKLLLVYSYLRKKDFEQARATAKQMTDQYPDNPGWWTVSGSVEMFAGERDKAREHFDKALQLDTNFSTARINLARLAFEDGNLAAADKQFDSVLSHDSGNVTALLGKAQVAERRGDGEQAVKWLEKARQANDNALLPRLILARYYFKTGDVKQSLTLAREAAALKPGNVEIHRLVAASLLKLDKPEEALETYRQISRQDPSNPLWKLELANVFQELKDYEQARAALDEALALDANYL
ncbi:MAG: PEP-CTERM system TPR-repeat protein PrsT, partial [Gammaproteobacteria bacterium]